MLSAISSLSTFVEKSTPVATTQVAPVQAEVSLNAAQSSFGDVMAQVAARATETIKAGETNAILGMQGKASVQQVVEAVMSAEQSLQTAIAIRDKVVAAYQEISRMAI